MGRNGVCIFSSGIKTKLDSADRFPIRQVDTPVQKRSLYKKTGFNHPVFFFCGEEIRCRFHGRRVGIVGEFSRNWSPNFRDLASGHGFASHDLLAFILTNGCAGKGKAGGVLLVVMARTVNRLPGQQMSYQKK